MPNSFLFQMISSQTKVISITHKKYGNWWATQGQQFMQNTIQQL